MTFFEEICNINSPHTLINMPCARRDALYGYMTVFSEISVKTLPRPGWGGSSRTDVATTQAFDSVMIFINQKLVQEISSLTVPARANPSLLFYAAALYVHHCKWMIRLGASPSFDSLHSIICRYKNATIDMGITDIIIEKQLASAAKNSFDEPLFSTRWWSIFETREAQSSGGSEINGTTPNGNITPGPADISSRTNHLHGGVETRPAMRESGSHLVTESPVSVISEHDRPYAAPEIDEIERTQHRSEVSSLRTDITSDGNPIDTSITNLP